MNFELYVEGELVDIDERISVQLSYAIDDVANFASRETAFSKTIVLPGTKRNHAVLGYLYDNATANSYSPASANIGRNYNVAQIARAELRMNGMLMIKGSFRVLSIIKDRDFVEYEAALFGELGGFAAAIGNGLLEDLDFSEYDHPYTVSGIVNSWDTISGSGYYYPLIDYGTYSSGKVDYDIQTFRPALYVKEYIDKMFSAAGYSYNSTFMNSDVFKKLIIPYNRKQLEKKAADILTATDENDTYNPSTSPAFAISFDTAIGGNFTINMGNNLFTYNGTDTLTVRVNLTMSGTYTSDEFFTLAVTQNGNDILGLTFDPGTNVPYSFTINTEIQLVQNDVIRVQILRDAPVAGMTLNVTSALFTITAEGGVVQLVDIGDQLGMNFLIPRGVRQLDFFSWILKMFNLYVDENRIEDKVLIIEPYYDYYDYSNPDDWTDKIDRSKPITITPMGMLNSRFYEMKFKGDNDFYNESYSKKYNENYGDRIFDSGFQFANEKQTTEVGFSATPLIQYDGNDKILGAIYKKSKGNEVDQEELMDSNIRIMLAKKITGASTWAIMDGVTVLQSLNAYGYAGHFDDPANPTIDINFGAVLEAYAIFGNYTGNNLFNVYWSGYIAQIIDKDSRIMSCQVKLDYLDIYQLDFSRPMIIDGQLWRLNKIEDFDPVVLEPVKCEFLKII
jgi:hypothetical protein